MFQKEFDKMNINMNDLEMLEKDENLLNQILMEIAQGKPGAVSGVPQDQVIEEEDEYNSDSQKSDARRKKPQKEEKSKQN